MHRVIDVVRATATILDDMHRMIDVLRVTATIVDNSSNLGICLDKISTHEYVVLDFVHKLLVCVVLECAHKLLDFVHKLHDRVHSTVCTKC